jgi:secreted PhoX family phosphatase
VIGRRALLAGTAMGAAPAMAQRLPPPAPALPPGPLAMRPDDWIAPGHARHVLIRWGDRVTFDAPPWDPRSPTEDAVAAQFGWDGRLAGLAVPPLGADRIPRLLLAVVHPQVDPAMAWPGGRDRPAVAAAMQGASLLNLEKAGDSWVVVDGGFQSRRLGANTLCRWTGPAAAAPGMVGMLGLEGGCATPWGSLLLTEGEPFAWLARLGGLDARWQEARRFGWVVELDPFDPQSVPAKRSALGRIGAVAVAATRAADGRAVVFLADGRGMGFLYRFVSARAAEEPDALDAGTLYVARAEQGGGLHWVALAPDSAADPARAAEALGATPFDTPSALALDTDGRRLVLGCRAGVSRQASQVDALNPRPSPHAGHVIELLGDPATPRMEARLLFEADSAPEMPRYPATLAVDARSRLWIGTDRAGRPGPAADAVFVCALEGPSRGIPRPAYAAPRAAGIGGAATTPGEDAALVLVRTPGAEPGASFDRPATRWPAFEARTPPRTALVALTRQGGGVVLG